MARKAKKTTKKRKKLSRKPLASVKTLRAASNPTPAPGGPVPIPYPN